MKQILLAVSLLVPVSWAVGEQVQPGGGSPSGRRSGPHFHYEIGAHQLFDFASWAPSPAPQPDFEQALGMVSKLGTPVQVGETQAEREGITKRFGPSWLGLCMDNLPRDKEGNAAIPFGVMYVETAGSSVKFLPFVTSISETPSSQRHDDSQAADLADPRERKLYATLFSEPDKDGQFGLYGEEGRGLRTKEPTLGFQVREYVDTTDKAPTPKLSLRVFCPRPGGCEVQGKRFAFAEDIQVCFMSPQDLSKPVELH